MTAQDNSGVPSWCRVGQRVVCISNWGGHVSWYLPKRGTVYVIALVDAGHQHGSMLELAGIGDARCGYKFPVKCFRPAVEPKSKAHDLAQFRKLLSVRQPEGADA